MDLKKFPNFFIVFLGLLLTLIEFLPLFVILTLFVPPGPALLHLNVDNFLIFQKNILNSTYIFDLGKLLQQLFLKLLIMNLSDCFTICVNTNFLSLVSHKKNYLVCVELSNFRILCNIQFGFFQRTKLRQPTGQRQLLENK